MKFGFDWPRGFRADFLTLCTMTEHGYTISSPCESDGSGELNKMVL